VADDRSVSEPEEGDIALGSIDQPIARLYGSRQRWAQHGRAVTAAYTQSDFAAFALSLLLWLNGCLVDHACKRAATVDRILSRLRSRSQGTRCFGLLGLMDIATMDAPNRALHATGERIIVGWLFHTDLHSERRNSADRLTPTIPLKATERREVLTSDCERRPSATASKTLAACLTSANSSRSKKTI
jgi:hypothetical protein